MKSLPAVLVLICLCHAGTAAAIAADNAASASTVLSANPANPTITSHQAVYRMSVFHSAYLLVPDAPIDSKSRPSLDQEESLARCDELVSDVLGIARKGPKAPEFVRDQTVPLRGGGAWVLYSQRHQGYLVVGAGARLVLDDHGQIVKASLNVESRPLPMFKAMDQATLLRIARDAVPHTITGAPLSSDIVLDPMDEGPARLFYSVTFPVVVEGKEGGWKVRVDAVDGKVVDSETTAKYIQKSRPRPTPIFYEDPGSGGGSGGGGDPPPPFTITVDIGSCLKLQLSYTNGYGKTEVDVRDFSYLPYVAPGWPMTISDLSDPTTCTKSFIVNGVTRTLPYTFTPQPSDHVQFVSDCRPNVRSTESLSPYCSFRDLTTNWIFPSDLSFNSTMNEWPIVSIARASNPTDYLAVPCQVTYTPPTMLTTVDNTRFDEVNAFYRARKYINEFLFPIGLPLSWGFRMFTKESEGLNENNTRFEITTNKLYLGEGDAFSWGSYSGRHQYDASKFASVIDHEVTHALFVQLYNNLASLPALESDAVEEGVCDYMAASYTGNPAIGVCYIKDYDHLRTCDNPASSFRYSIRSSVQYPVGSGFLAPAGTKHAEGMIVSGLLWDMRNLLGEIAADWILKDALQSRTSRPNFAQFGSAIMVAAQSHGYDCQVRPLLVAREFPGIVPISSDPPGNLAVSTELANRCFIHVTWTGAAPSYRVSWTPDGGAEQTKATVTSPGWDGDVGTKDGGTVKVYSLACGVTSAPSSRRREAVTATAQTTDVRLTNETVTAGTQTRVEWDFVAGAPSYRVMKNGIQMGGIVPGTQNWAIDPPGCAETASYCVEIVDCGGSHNVGPCRSITRPGSPLAVTMSGPASQTLGNAQDYTANITGGCGLSSVTWYWMTECDYLAANQLLVEECNEWYVYGTNPLQTTITKGWSHGNYADLKVTVVDLNGATATATKRITIVHSQPSALAPGGSSSDATAEAELPTRLSWDGRTLALVNIHSSTSGPATLQVFDVAGRRWVKSAVVTGSSSRMDLALPGLTRGVYFARVELAQGAVLQRMIVMR